MPITKPAQIQTRREMKYNVILTGVRVTIVYAVKRHDFRKKKLFSTKCVFWFSQQTCLEDFLF